MGTTAEKLTYLNETKTKLKDMLNLGGASLTTEPFRQYVDTLKNRYLYFMNNGTQQVWNNWDKVEGTGETITLNNTEEAPMSLVYKGNTYQDSTTGKNLYNDNFDDYTQPVNYRICPITLTQGQTYVLKGNKIGTTITGAVVAVVPYGEQYTDFSSQLKMAVDSQGYGHTLTFTPDSTWTSPKLAIYASDKTTFDNLFTNYEIQLEKGSAATSYEPYTNGASPNPDYPQDIHVVSGDNSIEVSNGDNTQSASYPISLGVENLWTLSDTFTSTSASQWVLGDTNFELKAGTYYLDINATINKNVAFNFKDSNNTATSIYLSSTNTITFANDIKKVSIRIDTANNTISNIRLIKGNKAQHISSTPIELCKIGTYQDKIDKSSGKNLFNSINWRRTASGGGYPAVSDNYSTIVSSNNNNIVFTATGNYGGVESDFFPVKSGETYTISFSGQGTLPNRFFITQYDNAKTRVSTLNNTSVATVSNTTFTTTQEGYIAISFNNSTSSSSNFTINNIMLNEGTTALPYEPYGTGWYVKKEIGKVVYTGASDESWSLVGSTFNWFAIRNDNIDTSNYTTTVKILCDYYKARTYANTINSGECTTYQNGVQHMLAIKNTDISSVENFKTWLSTHNTIVYYVLATPTYTEITDSTLLSQLNALAKSYTGQTNISQESNDLASLLNATALREMA